MLCTFLLPGDVRTTTVLRFIVFSVFVVKNNLVWVAGFKPTTSPVQAEYSDQTELHPENIGTTTQT